MKTFPKDKHGIIISCDFGNLEKLEQIVEATCSLDFIEGYKIGMTIALKDGIQKSASIIRKYTDLPIIYDHQKFGSDIPEICSGEILQVIKNAGIEALVVFPHGGIETLRSVVKECSRIGLIPIVGGDMTHSGYNTKDGGYIDEGASQRIYIDAATIGVTHFMLPCLKLERIKIYMHKLVNIVNDPQIFITGIREEVTDDLLEVCKIIHEYNSYAVIGRGITEEKDFGFAASKFWEKIQERINS